MGALGKTGATRSHSNTPSHRTCLVAGRQGIHRHNAVTAKANGMANIPIHQIWLAFGSAQFNMFPFPLTPPADADLRGSLLLAVGRIQFVDQALQLVELLLGEALGLDQMHGQRRRRTIVQVTDQCFEPGPPDAIAGELGPKESF